MSGKKPPWDARKRPVQNLQDAVSATSGAVETRALHLQFRAAIGGMKKPLTNRRDQRVEELQKALTAERDERRAEREEWREGQREERFISIVALLILLDVMFFSVIDNLTGPLVLLILELLLVVSLTRRMGMKESAQLIYRILDYLVGCINNK